MFKFEVLHQSTKSRARVGRIYTAHGVIDTPNFVPVATNGTIKALDTAMLDDLDVQLMFCNTYHLLLHPGSDIIAQAGGLHTFMRRNRPLITDSGGFQVFSLAYGGVHNELKSKGQKSHNGSVVKITEEGVAFRSYRDGTKIILTPESSVQAQKLLGADIIIPFDELPPYHIAELDLKKSLDRTHRWEKRSLDEHKKNPRGQAMYAVVHGGVDPHLRRQSAQYLDSLGFDGFAIGGSLGKERVEMITMLQNLMPFIPSPAPNHLLGIGDLRSLEMAIPLGIDTFDSSYPTKCARHGLLLTPEGSLNLLQVRYKNAFRPVDENCTCYACQRYTIAYQHHLFKAHEITGLVLATIHNIAFMMKLMKNYRQLILDNQV